MKKSIRYNETPSQQIKLQSNENLTRKNNRKKSQQTDQAPTMFLHTLESTD